MTFRVTFRGDGGGRQKGRSRLAGGARGASCAEPQDTELAAAAVTARGTVERCTVERFALRCGHLNGTDSSVGASAQWDSPRMASAGVG